MCERLSAPNVRMWSSCLKKGYGGAQVSKREPGILWVGCSTCGLSKWSSGLSGCPHTSPPSLEQLANYSTCGETHSHIHAQQAMAKHMFSLISRTHTCSLCPMHTYTSCLSHYRSPQAQLAGWKAQFVYSCGDYGERGGVEMHLTEHRGISPKPP